MSFIPALLLSAGVGVALFSTPTTKDDLEEDSDTIARIVRAVTLTTTQTKRKTESPDYRKYDYEEYETKGETPDDEEEVEGPEYVNPKRELKAITTDLVNRNFLARKSDVFHFLRLVIQTHTDALDMYAARKGLKPTQVRFVYKGGNVLRIVASEFLVELPGYATDTINDFYMGFFKRSDADFSIYIDPSLKNFDEIHHELTLLTWQLQRYIRAQITAAPHKFFEYFRLNTESKRQVLTRYLKELNAAEALRDPSNDRFYGASFEEVAFEGLSSSADSRIEDTRDADTFIVPKSDNTVTFSPEPDQLHYLRIQYNTALEFSSGKGHQASFILVRTKVIFDTTMKLDNGGLEQHLKIGGELIDVSLPRQNDTGLKDFFHGLKKNGDVLDHYELRYSENGGGDSSEEKLRFQGYSLNWLINDLDYVLFVSAAKPWDDTKYVKRLSRLFYLCFVQTFVRFESNVKRRDYLAEFCKRVATKAREKDIGARVKRFSEKWGEANLGFNKLAARVAEVAVGPDDPHYTDYVDFVEHLQKNCVIVLRAFRNIGQFCGRKNPLPETRIYEGDFSALVRGDM